MLTHKELQGRFVLTHFDAFYSNGVLESLLTMLTGLMKSGQIQAANLAIHFINGRPNRDLISRLALGKNVLYSTADSLHKAEALARAHASSVLFIQRAAGNGYIPEKFFRFLALRKTVFALVRNPVAYEDLLGPQHDVYLADLDDAAGVSRQFLRMYHEWQRMRELEAERERSQIVTGVPRVWSAVAVGAMPTVIPAVEEES